MQDLELHLDLDGETKAEVFRIPEERQVELKKLINTLLTKALLESKGTIGVMVNISKEVKNANELVYCSLFIYSVSALEDDVLRMLDGVTATKIKTKGEA